MKPTGNFSLPRSSGEMGKLVTAFDWSKTAIGEPSTWPRSLSAVVSMVLSGGFPAIVLWGDDLLQIYNDGYCRLMGLKHPVGLGQRTRDCWPEVWHINEPIYERVRQGETITLENALFPITRHGELEDAWFTLSYGPLFGDEETIEGVLVTVVETTEQVRADLQRANSERRLAQLFEQAPTFMALLEGPEHRFVLANPGYTRVTGNRPLIGKTLAEALPEAIEQGYVRLLDQVYLTGTPYLASGSPYRIELDGQEPVDFIVDFVYQPIRDAEGRVTGIFIEGADVTERSKATAALRKSEEKLRSVNERIEKQLSGRIAGSAQTWEVSPDLFSVIRLSDGCFERTNPAWASLGWSMADLEGAHYESLVHPHDLEPSRVAFGAVQRGEPVLRFVNRYRCRDGSYRHLSWLAVPDGVRLYSTARDVTDDEVRAASLLERTAERDRLWQTSPDLLVVFDFEGVFRRVNPSWCHILGYAKADLVGQRFGSLLHPDDVAASADALDTAIKGPLTGFENRLRHKDGSYRWFSWVAAPEHALIYATGRHVTLDRERQSALETAEASLRQSQKLDQIGQLTGGVAHDFNNVLTVIRTSIDVLRLPALEPERRPRFLDSISDAVTRGAKLTSQLLAFARRQALKPEVFDAVQSTRAVSSMIASLAGVRIELELLAPDEPLFVNADPSQFDTALVNLAINARDAMAGQGRLIIAVAKVDAIPEQQSNARQLGKFVTVSVTDFGTGIRDDQRSQIFEPFYTTKESGHGTGLGLSQVYGFAKQSGGEIAVESVFGKGSTFTLYLPKADAVLRGALASSLHPTSKNGAGSQILVVEDNPAVAASVEQTLQMLSYRAVLARDATSALDELRADSNRFAAVFSDVVMPGMSGIEMGLQIRREFPGLPVLLASGYTYVLASEGEHGFQLLQKPYSVDDLAEALGAAIHRRDDRDPVPAEDQSD